MAVYEYFITAGLGPLIQFRLPISTLHLTVCCYLFLLCCDVFIYLQWMVLLCLTLPTLLLLSVVPVGSCVLLHWKEPLARSPWELSAWSSVSHCPKQILMLITVSEHFPSLACDVASFAD